VARFVEAIAWIKKDRDQQQRHGPLSSFWSASILSCFQACKCCFSFIVKLSADFISLFLYSHVPRFFSVLFNQSNSRSATVEHSQPRLDSCTTS